MTSNPLPPSSRLLELAGGLLLIVWGIYKKEIQDLIRNLVQRLSTALRAVLVALLSYFLPPAPRMSDSELEAILKPGLKRLERLLLLLLGDYKADRVTLTEYKEQADGSWLATCVVEVTKGEMTSVEEELQDQQVHPAIQKMLVRIHESPNRSLYVPDARLVEIAAMQDALLKSEVRSAYYQSLPNSEGAMHTLLAISWRQEKHLTQEDLAGLHYTGICCATVLLDREQLKKISKMWSQPSTGA